MSLDNLLVPRGRAGSHVRGGEFVSVGLEEAVTVGNLVTGPAWTVHVEWLNTRRVRGRFDTPRRAG